MVLGTLPLAKVMMDFFTYTCSPDTIYSIDADTRSGSYSLLDVVHPDLSCIKPHTRVTLTSKGSSVEIHQVLCKDMEVKPFQAEVDLDQPSTIVNEPIPAFDENFTPQNYFITGNMEIEIMNATTNASSVIVELCLFSNTYDYNQFLRAGKSWKNYTQTADCNLTAIKVGKKTSIGTFFNLTKPSFAFLGLASTGPLAISQLKVNATGSMISSIVGNSKECQLSDKHATCTVDFSLQNESICIVAYEEGNPDGTYDYSNLTLNFDRVNHNPFRPELMAYGISSIILLVILLLALIVTCVVWCKQDNGSFPIEEISQDHDSAEDDNGRFSQPITVSTN